VIGHVDALQWARVPRRNDHLLGLQVQVVVQDQHCRARLKSSLRGQNEQMRSLAWKVGLRGGGWWIRPVIGSKSWIRNVHG
jgi:hypothetical protein